jgi:hypothetical protein
MKHILAPLVIAAMATPLAAQTIDVDQPDTSVCMAGFGQVDLAQSFIPTASDCSGAGVFMSAGLGSAETLTFSLYEGGLPGQGGTMIASATGLVSPGVWTDLFWPAVAVTPGNTYYLDLSPTASMCYAGSTSNPYAGGQVYANSGYGGFPSFDYSFRTYSGGGLTLAVTGACPSVTFTVSGATPFGGIALLTGPSSSSFTVAGGACAGTTLGVSPPTLRTVVGADASGGLSLSLTLPAGACGTLFLQAVDVSTCSPSNVEAL